MYIDKMVLLSGFAVMVGARSAARFIGREDLVKCVDRVSAYLLLLLAYCNQIFKIMFQETVEISLLIC